MYTLRAGRYTGHRAARCLRAWRAEGVPEAVGKEFWVGVKGLGLQGLGRAQGWAGPSDQWELCQPCPCPREPVNEKPPQSLAVPSLGWGHRGTKWPVHRVPDLGRGRICNSRVS